MTELICIGCPKGCHLKVDEENNYTVTGNNCEVGANYGKEELTNPKRTLTTTIITEDGILVPVRSDIGLPKGLMFEAMKIINETVVKKPIQMRQIIIENILNTGVNIVSCKEVK